MLEEIRPENAHKTFPDKDRQTDRPADLYTQRRKQTDWLTD